LYAATNFRIATCTLRVATNALRVATNALRVATNALRVATNALRVATYVVCVATNDFHGATHVCIFTHTVHRPIYPRTWYLVLRTIYHMCAYTPDV